MESNLWIGRASQAESDAFGALTAFNRIGCNSSSSPTTQSSSTSCVTSSGSMSIHPLMRLFSRSMRNRKSQAPDRTQPGLPMKKGRAGTMTHDFKRHGTTTLFAAFDVLANPDKIIAAEWIGRAPGSASISHLQSVHRVRSRLVGQRTAVINQIPVSFLSMVLQYDKDQPGYVRRCPPFWHCAPVSFRHSFYGCSRTSSTIGASSMEGLKTLRRRSKHLPNRTTTASALWERLGSDR